MTAIEIKRILQEVNNCLDIKGGCKILSKGDGCICSKCQIDRMDPEEILHAINRRYG